MKCKNAIDGMAQLHGSGIVRRNRLDFCYPAGRSEVRSGGRIRRKMWRTELVVLFGLLAAVAGSSQQAKKTDVELLGLKGSVQTCLSEFTRLQYTDRGEVEINRHRDRLWVFDRKGNLIEQQEYRATDGSLNYRVVFACEVEGRRSGSAKYDSSGLLVEKSAYVYDPKGELTEVTVHGTDGSLKEKEHYVYDDRGNQTESFSFDADGPMNSKSVYDGKGNVIEMLGYKPDGSLIARYVFAYNDKGNQKEWIQYEADGSCTAKVVYASDVSGNWIKDLYYNSDGSIFDEASRSYIFDSTGNWTKTIVRRRSTAYVEYRTFRYFP